MGIVQRFGSAIKAAASSFVMTFGGGWSSWAGGGWGSWGTGGQIDYANRVGDGRGSSLVFATLAWIGRKFPDGKLSLRSLNADGTKDAALGHPFLRLLRKPNDFYGGSAMLVAAVWDWFLTGDAYLIKVRNGLKAPVQLWYVPSYLMKAVSEDETVFVQYYRYSPGGRSVKLDPSEVVHIRNGIDPNNIRQGLSRLACLTREIYSDDEAARWTASVLTNSGIPSVIISPDGESQVGPEEAEGIKTTYVARFGGNNRGAPMVMSSKMKVERMSFSPQELNLGELRRIPEERVTAVLGIPAVVVGLGAGLDAATYSNLAALREAAVEDTLLPMFRVFAEELQAQLLPDFVGNPDAFEVYFDTSDIRELQPDLDKLVLRENAKLVSGGITLGEYRTNIGQDIELPGQADILYLPVNLVPTNVADIIPEPIALPPPPTPIALPAPLAAVAALGDDGVETKALGVIAGVRALRGRLQAPEERAIKRLLATQRDLALAALTESVKNADGLDVELKAIAIDSMMGRLESVFASAWRGLLERLHLRAATGVHDLVSEWANVDIPIDRALRARYVETAGANVSGITETGIKGLRRVLTESVDAGETLAETIERVKALGVFGDARAATISRTELGIATNMASLESYKASKIVEMVVCHDGTQHDEECASLNGQEMTVEAAMAIPSLSHPNCSRSFSPLTRATRGTSNGHVERKELVEV